MASAKDTFEASAFLAITFGSGTWRGSTTKVNRGRAVAGTVHEYFVAGDVKTMKAAGQVITEHDSVGEVI